VQVDHRDEKAIRAIVRSWRPDLIDLTGVGPIVAASQASQDWTR
jgi:hypothetical protein